MLIDTYSHKMGAHCESGALTSLLNHAGMEITEPLVFGLGSGYYFGYFHRSPNFNFPFFFLRTKPGELRKTIQKNLGIKFHTQKFKNPEDSEKALDELLRKNIPVAVQVDFYYMDYIPPWERVHANIHHIIVVGKDEKKDKYIVSDSYFPTLAKISMEQLRKARFTGGYLAPKGFLYYPEVLPESIDYEKNAVKSLKKSIKNMIGLPVPFIGVKGIRRFGKKVVDWPKFARDIDHLSHEVMKINVFLEDQGTGGAGFRYIFATFLREISEKTNNPLFEEFSKKMMEIGDGWRNLSYFAAKIGKNRDLGEERFKELSEMIYDRADAEEKFFKELKMVLK